MSYYDDYMGDGDYTSSVFDDPGSGPTADIEDVKEASEDPLRKPLPPLKKGTETASTRDRREIQIKLPKDMNIDPVLVGFGVFVAAVLLS